MNEILQYAKQHPATAIGVGGVGFVVLVLLLKGKSGNTSPQAAIAGATLQEQQIQAGVAVQQANIAVQNHAADLQAQIQQNQTNAALSVQNEQTDAALIASLYQNKTQLENAKVAADVLNNQYSTEANVINHQTDAAVTVAGQQTDLQKFAYAQAEQIQRENVQALLPYVTKINGSQNRLSLLQSLAGNFGAANTAAAGQTVSSVSGDNLLSSITGNITKAFTSLFG